MVLPLCLSTIMGAASAKAPRVVRNADSERPSQAGALPMRDSHVLRVIRGPELGALWSLYEGEAIVGRGLQASVRIEDESVSPQHARIIVGPAGVTLRDLGSDTGTYVEGKKLKGPVVLRDGERIVLGNVCLRLDALDPYERLVEMRLREASVRDPLTGLYNRGVFDERLASEVAFARRHGSALGVVMIDVDHFKSVNDNYGHAVGDAVLRSVAERLQTCVRTEDVTARYGGEELSVIVRGADRNGLAQLAERIRSAIEGGRLSNNGRIIQVTASCGTAFVTGQRAREATPLSLVQAADAALYAAKHAGRNRVVAAD